MPQVQNKVKKGYHLFLNHLCSGKLNGIAERNALGNFLNLSSILVVKLAAVLIQHFLNTMEHLRFLRF